MKYQRDLTLKFLEKGRMYTEVDFFDVSYHKFDFLAGYNSLCMVRHRLPPFLNCLLGASTDQDEDFAGWQLQSQLIQETTSEAPSAPGQEDGVAFKYLFIPSSHDFICVQGVRDRT
jgi:hypothetical protein